MPAVFFRAEDGIRDHCVTGVQTCALPISWPSRTKVGEGHADLGLAKPRAGANPVLRPGRTAAQNNDRNEKRSEERRVGKECRSLRDTQTEEQQIKRDEFEIKVINQIDRTK